MILSNVARSRGWIAIGGIIASLISAQEARGQEPPLPSPWDQVSGLSPRERTRIRLLADSVERAPVAFAPWGGDNYIYDHLLALGRSPSEARREADYLTAQAKKQARFHRDLRILSELSGQPRSEAVQVLSTYVDTVQVFEFASFSARQQEPFWCWAAALQAVFAHAGVRLSQEDVGRLIGTSDSGPVDSIAIRSISGWHTGAEGPWTSECSLLPRDVPNGYATIIYAGLRQNKPVIAVIDNDHVVVVHAAVVRPFPDVAVDSLTWFDPYTGSRTLRWAEAKERITDVWLCWAVPPDRF